MTYKRYLGTAYDYKYPDIKGNTSERALGGILNERDEIDEDHRKAA